MILTFLPCCASCATAVRIWPRVVTWQFAHTAITSYFNKPDAPGFHHQYESHDDQWAKGTWATH